MKTSSLVMGCVCAAIMFAGVAPVSVADDDGPDREILLRKARKYRLNPNLLESVVVVEVAAAKLKLDNAQVVEWVAEQSARVLAHVMTRTEDLFLVLKLYATGGTDIEEPVDQQTTKFINDVRRTFRKLEKARPWDKTYPEENVATKAKE